MLKGAKAKFYQRSTCHDVILHDAINMDDNNSSKMKFVGICFCLFVVFTFNHDFSFLLTFLMFSNII